MKKLIENINEIQFESFMQDINESIINESLESSILKKIAALLKPFGSKHKSQGAYMGNNSFSGVFGRLDATWDKIKDSDFEEYKAGDKKGIKKMRDILSSTRGWLNAIILVKNDDDPNDFNSMFCYRGKVDFKAQKWHYNEKSEYVKVNTIEEYPNYLQKYAKEELEKHDFLFLDLTNFGIYDLRGKRNDAQRGMILQGDSNYYKKLASENVERYKKIIAKKKAEAAAKSDTISQDVKNIVDELMDLSITAAKNPDEYIDVEYMLGSAIEDVYSVIHYNNGRTHGHNGLLYLYKEYLQAHLSMVKDGGYNFERNAQDNKKKEIEKAIQGLQTRIQKIKEKISK